MQVFRGTRSHVGDALGRAKRLLRQSFSGDHTTEQVARSFGLGVFITMLPTLGVGFVVFLVLSTVFDGLSKVALVASAVVFNPVVKWGVYALSLGLGVLLLGPVEGASMADASLSAAPAVVVRLVLGNVILAVVVALASYVLSFRFLDRYADTATEYIGDVSDRLAAPIGGVNDATGLIESASGDGEERERCD